MVTLVCWRESAEELGWQAEDALAELTHHAEASDERAQRKQVIWLFQSTRLLALFCSNESNLCGRIPPAMRRLSILP